MAKAKQPDPGATPSKGRGNEAAPVNRSDKLGSDLLPALQLRGLFASALVSALALMLLWVLVVAKQLLMPLAVAVLIWLVVNGMARSLRSKLRVRGRALPFWACLMVSLAGTALLTVLAAIHVAGNIQDMIAAAPRYQSGITTLAQHVAAALGMEGTDDLTALLKGFDLRSMVLPLANATADLVGSAGTIALYVAFLFVEQQVFPDKLLALLPDTRKREHVKALAERMRLSIQSYLLAKTLTSALTAVCTWAVLVLAGVDFADFWGFLAFVANFIPIVGSLVSSVVPILLAFLQYSLTGPFFAASIGLVLVQAVIGNVIEPRLLGRSVNLSPLAVILMLALWGYLWGIAGMVLSIPITVILMIVSAEFDSTRPLAVALSERGRIPARSA